MSGGLIVLIFVISVGICVNIRGDNFCRGTYKPSAYVDYALLAFVFYFLYSICDGVAKGLK